MPTAPQSCDAVRERIRTICLGLPETSERLSHGAPTFFELAGIAEDAYAERA